MENLGEVYVGYDGQPKSTEFGRKSLRLGRKLEPGFVLTIEPGVYFIPELMDLWRSQNVVDNDGPHSPREVTGQKALAKGLHPIEVKYFDHNGLSSRVSTLSLN